MVHQCGCGGGSEKKAVRNCDVCDVVFEEGKLIAHAASRLIDSSCEATCSRGFFLTNTSIGVDITLESFLFFFFNMVIVSKILRINLTFITKKKNDFRDHPYLLPLSLMVPISQVCLVYLWQVNDSEERCVCVPGPGGGT